MLEAAGELFVERGYGATTQQEIADRAGVALQTIYYTFGNKRRLLKELVDTSVAGDDEPVAIPDRPWFREILAADTAESLIGAHVAGMRQTLQRVAAIMEMLRIAASTDLDIGEMWPHQGSPRHEVQSTVARALVTKPGARTGLAAEHVADILYGLLSPQLYLLFTRDRGWSPEQWERWMQDTLLAQLCSP